MIVSLFAAILLNGGCSRNGAPPDASTPGASTTGDTSTDSEVATGPRLLGQVTDFSLTNQAGRKVKLSDLRGKVWIANFIFTRCLATCPVQSLELAQLQTKLRSTPSWDDIRFVSYSVDPEFDTPEVMASYAHNYGADEDHWSFLTGTRDEIWALSKNGFKLAVGQDAKSANMPIFHSPQFILIDRTGQIRGYYDSGKKWELTKLEEDLQSVLAEPFDAAVFLNAEGKGVSASIRPLPFPDDVRSPPWLAKQKGQQLATKPSFDVYCDFRFTDKHDESGIAFENKSVDYACKVNIAAHYDHGNGISVADVDSDGLLDIYFNTQIGSNRLLKNLGKGQFTDITTPGIGLPNSIGVSSSFADTDNDGDADLFVTTTRGGNHFFENDGTGNFIDRRESSGLGYNGHSSSGVFFDYNGDGLLDLFLCNVGIFTSEEADEQGTYLPLSDAFAGHLKPAQRSEKSILYKNIGNNRFVDVSNETGLVDASWSGDASPIDVNNDGWIDLYVTNMQGHDEYYQNVDGKRFTKRSREVFPKTSWGAMGIQVLDFDNDGNMDIFITDMHSDMSTPVEFDAENQKSKIIWPESMLRSGGMSIFGNSFFKNQGDGSFVEISDKIGAENYWPWGLSSGDLNADGFEDVFITSSMNYPFRYCVNKLLLNDRGRRFRDSEFILGVEPRKDGVTAKPNFKLDPTGEDANHQLVERLKIKEPVEVWGALGSRSSVLFDLDNDGDLDIVTNEFNDGPMVLVSDLTSRKSIHWLKVTLTGTTSNRDGVGAKVTVHTQNDIYTKINDNRSGYLSQSVTPLYFGLRDAASVDKIVVEWPQGKTQTVKGPLESNRLIEVTEN